MNKEEYLNILERELMDVSAGERIEALQFILEYFDEAGEEREPEIIEELGDPAYLAQALKKDLETNACSSEPKADDISGHTFSDSIARILAFARDIRNSVETELESSAGSGKVVIPIPEKDAAVVENLEIETSIGDIKMIPGPRLELTCKDFSAQELASLEVQTRGNNCFIRAKSSGILSKGRSMILTLPKSLESIRVSSSTGDIKLDGIRSGVLNIHSAMGSVKCSDCACRNLEAQLAMGDFKYSGSVSQGISAKLSCGDMKLRMRDDLAAYSLNLVTNMGDIKCPMYKSQIFRRWTSQSLKVDGPGDRYIYAAGSMGDISLKEYE